MTAVRRVLIVGPTPPPYHGVATYIRDMLGDASSRPGFQLDHLDTSDRRDASNLGRWEAGNLALGFSHLAEMASRLNRVRHELVYVPISQNVPAFLRDALFIFQARYYGARVVLHLHGGYFREFFDRQSAEFRMIARAALNRASAVAVLSSEFRHIFEDLVPDERIHVVENGVPDLFAESAANPHGNSESPTALYMSTLARTKGILDLLRAVALARRDIPGIRLRVAGGWSEEDTRREALRVIEEERLADCVEFVGNVDGEAKRAFLKSGDLFCLPTRYPYEGQPLAVLEAMSAGLPVLTTRHGALASTVVQDETGELLDRAAGPAPLAAALRAMLADPQKSRAQGRAARQRYLERYTAERCHRRLAEVFEAALR